MDVAHLNWIDGFVLLCASWPLIRGLQLGLVQSLLRMAGVAAGVILGFALLPWSTAWIASIPFATPRVAPVAAFSAVALVGGGTGYAAGFLWRKFALESTLGWIDRLAGGAVGLVKGLLIASAALFALAFALPALEIAEGVRNSMIGRQVVEPARNAARHALGNWERAWRGAVGGLLPWAPEGLRRDTLVTPRATPPTSAPSGRAPAASPGGAHPHDLRTTAAPAASTIGAPAPALRSPAGK